MLIVFSHFLFTIVSFVEYLVAGMSYPDEAVRASVVYILVQLCVRKEDAVLALPLVHTMCHSLSVSLATSLKKDKFTDDKQSEYHTIVLLYKQTTHSRYSYMGTQYNTDPLTHEVDGQLMRS